MKAFKDVFKEMRQSRDLTQTELAKQLKISRSTVGMYEAGNRVPHREDLENIADFFNGITTATPVFIRVSEHFVYHVYSTKNPRQVLTAGDFYCIGLIH